MSSHLNSLCARLSYDFKNAALLNQALMHRSLGPLNNEQLEFLGDSVLNLVITSLLMELFPEQAEGRLSRMRASLVNEDTLVEVAKSLNLGEVVKLGRGELRSGGHRRKSILADALEAIFGAVYLDGGFGAAQQVIVPLFRDRCMVETLEKNMYDYKSALQEKIQGLKMPLPIYTLTRVTGELHEQLFHVSCTVVGVLFSGKGQGPTRRKAEQAAAFELLHQMKT